jgi:hypothetical protein
MRAIDIEIEPRTYVDQPNRVRPYPASRLRNGRIQHGAASVVGRVCRHGMATTESFIRTSVSIAA